NELDIGAAVSAAQQARGDFENLSGVVEAVEVVSWIPPYEVDVGAETDVLHTHELRDVVHVIQHVLDGNRAALFYEVADGGDSHRRAFRRRLANRSIGLAARTARVKRAEVGVRDQRGPGGGFDGIQGGAIAAMRNIDRHTESVHTLNDLSTEFGEATLL